MTAPAPAAICANIFGARRIRMTMVDGCGRPVWGPQSQVVSKGFTAVEIGNEVEAGDEVSLKNAAGEQCFPPSKNPDQIKWHTIKITFCNVDPAAFLLVNRTWKRVTNADRTTTTGVRGSLAFSDSLGFALELWPKVGAGASQICVAEDIPDPEVEVNGYVLVPWIISQAPDSFNFANEPTTFALNGISKVGSLWGRGPYNVTRDTAGQPSRLLDPIDPGFNVPTWVPPFVTAGDPDPFHLEFVTVRPPDPQCGALPLWNPDATAPVITVAADPSEPSMTAKLTVTNFDATGKSGTVDWGDGVKDAVPAASNGVATHPYAAGEAGIEQTVSYFAGTGAAPVTQTFTPRTPPAATDETADQAADQPAASGSGRKSGRSGSGTGAAGQADPSP